MGSLGAILVGFGIIAIIWSFMQRFKSGRLAKTPYVKTGEAASRGAQLASNGALSTEGAVRCDAPLLSPVSGTPCLYYELTVEGSWKDGDSRKSKKYIEEKVAAPFALDDGSGPVAIDARKGGDFELQKKFDETKKEGFFADLKSAVGKGEPIQFGRYGFANPVGSKADTFQCVERVLPVPPRLYANGKFEGGVITTPGFLSLMLSSKTRDELVGATEKSAKMSLYGGLGAGAVGGVFGVIGALTAPAAPPAPPPAAVIASPAEALLAAPSELTVGEYGPFLVSADTRATDSQCADIGSTQTDATAREAERTNVVTALRDMFHVAESSIGTAPCVTENQLPGACSIRQLNALNHYYSDGAQPQTVESAKAHCEAQRGTWID